MKKLLLCTLLLVGFLSTSVFATDKIHKVVIQVSTDDARTQKIALNNAVNLQRLYGIDNVIVEIVAYGPGLTLLMSKNKQSQRISSLSLSDITFSACQNTMNGFKKKHGYFPKLTAEVGKVTSGVARIVELQEEGYSYIRP